jgi:alpha-L-rhamnosidase
LIQSAWRIDGENLCVTITIPPNTTATVYLPTSDASSITESGKPVRDVPELQCITVENDIAVFDVPAGTYAFASPYRPLKPR